ncbi:MAG TPA: response regulator [Dehalococcoidia bacterium]|nr:response regulator [Dehalococcoidia bacterium]
MLATDASSNLALIPGTDWGMISMETKILIIEDDPVGLRYIRFTLEKHGYQVITAGNGLEGLRKARTEEPDLVILDVMLPGMDGYEICHRLRAEPATARLPILMFSARSQDKDKAVGRQVGADDYLTKPAEPSEIIRRVESLLS